jgi:hypothetical protein
MMWKSCAGLLSNFLATVHPSAMLIQSGFNASIDLHTGVLA